MLKLSLDKRIKMEKAGRDKIVQYFDEKIVIAKYLSAVKEISK